MHYVNSRQSGAFFAQSKAVRAGAGVASLGAFVAASMFGASAANAAVDTDCVGVTASTNVGLQLLLDDINNPLVCVQGAVPITTTLTYNHDVVIHGLPGAVLDGGGSTQILSQLNPGNFDSLTVENLRFTGGKPAAAEDGGAIQAYYVDVFNSQFDNNKGIDGGAIIAYSATILDSVFFDNEALDYGGAVYVTDTIYTERTTYHHNTASLQGGATYSENYTEIHKSTFNNNSATSGGAVFGESYTSIENSTFVENQAAPVAGTGGAVLSNGSGTLLQNTFLDNTASAAGGMAVSYDGNGTFEIRANIFAGTAIGPQLNYSAVQITDLNGNVFTTPSEPAILAIQTTTALNVPLALIFGGNVLASNGGPTQTVALPDGSFAIDFVPVGTPDVTDDQRGVARSALSDAGAYEHENPAAATIAATGSEPSWWLAGIAGALVLAGALAAAFGRVAARRR